MACPVFSSPQWQALVAKIGTFEAMKEFIRNGEEIPDADKYEQTHKGVDFAMRIAEILTKPKTQDYFNRFYTKGNKEKFFQELAAQGASKQQVTMLRNWEQNNSPATINEMLMGVLSELSYTVAIKTSTELNDNSRISPEDEPNEEQFKHEGYEYWATPDYGGFTKKALSNDNPFDVGDEITAAEYMAAKQATGILQQSPTQTYSEMTVPGGTNYSEQEIKTPDITPSIKGHAAFATDKGIGWFRSDDRQYRNANRNFYNMYLEETGQSGEYEDVVYTDEFQNWVESKQGAADLEDKSHVPTRRILELQSDLFQKGRDKLSLTKPTFKEIIDNLVASGELKIECD